MTTLPQTRPAHHPVPDLSPDDLQWWAENGPHALAPMPEHVALANDPRDFAGCWEEYERWADAADAAMPEPDAEAERAAAYDAWVAYSAAMGRWVDGRGLRPE